MADGTEQMFPPLSAEDPQQEPTEIESLCMNCHENGITRLLMTKIPFYKEVVVSSFNCEHCGYKNSELMPGGRLEEQGVRITLRVCEVDDLNRTVCKSDYTQVRIPDLDFEIPSRSQKGCITSVEGVIDRSIEGLEQDQEARREQDPEGAEKIDAFVERLKALKAKAEFTFVVEDISGNAFVSNPKAPAKDDRVTVTHFVRSKEQNLTLGIDDQAGIPTMSEEEYSYENLIQSVMQFPTNCSHCNAPCETNMKLTKVPFFKEVVIMATVCDTCGHRSNEVKSGGGIEPQGMVATIKVTKKEDFTRDILKSETCSLEIPELELEVGSRALGGRFTTVEGLLVAMKDQICESSAMFRDSRDAASKTRMKTFLERFDKLLEGSRPFTLVLNDPAGNSYVQSMPEPDTSLTMTKYDRTEEQNDDLGISDMKTENYGE